MRNNEFEWDNAKAASNVRKHDVSYEDAQPIPEGAPRRTWRGLLPRILFNRLGLSVEEFAARYQVPLDLATAWHTNKIWPDPVASAYLKAIAADPEGVARAVSGRKEAAE